MAGLLLSPSTTVSSTNKTDRHDITEILLKMALNTITLYENLTSFVWRGSGKGNNSEIINRPLRYVYGAFVVYLISSFIVFVQRLPFSAEKTKKNKKNDNIFFS